MLLEQPVEEREVSLRLVDSYCLARGLPVRKARPRDFRIEHFVTRCRAKLGMRVEDERRNILRRDAGTLRVHCELSAEVLFIATHHFKCPVQIKCLRFSRWLGSADIEAHEVLISFPISAPPSHLH